MSATIEITDAIAVIKMDDGKTNDINPAMLTALNACLDRAEKEAKAVVIAGRDQRFSGGFDLSVLMGFTPDDVRNLVKGGGRLAVRLYSFPRPVVAACTGHAIAMGSFILSPATSALARGDSSRLARTKARSKWSCRILRSSCSRRVSVHAI